jgi:hypothetical protein
MEKVILLKNGKPRKYAITQHYKPEEREEKYSAKRLEITKKNYAKKHGIENAIKKLKIYVEQGLISKEAIIKMFQ